MIVGAARDDAETTRNPLRFERQVIGFIMQGLGAVLTEEFFYDEGGLPLTSSFESYSLLAATGLYGNDIDTALRPILSPRNSFGVKVIGEVRAIGSPGAVANARSRVGAMATAPPSSPESVWWALSASKTR